MRQLERKPRQCDLRSKQLVESKLMSILKPHAHFHNLNPADHEMLVKISEEASEVAQAVAKILLHGLESYEPKNPAVTNVERLQFELADLCFFVNIAVKQGLLNGDNITKALEDRFNRPVNYLHHLKVI